MSTETSDRSHPLSTVAISAVLVTCIVVFTATVDAHDALENWLVWRYLGYWLAALVWALSCAAAGLFILRVMRFAPAREDALVWAFPLGVFSFHFAIFVLGLAHVLHRSVFFLLPFGCIAVGARELLEELRKRWQQRASYSHVRLIVVAFGLCGVALLYFQVLSPETFSHDSRWYHLPIAQQYAIDGAVKPWPEGWWLAAYPHLSSYLYSWAFLLPVGLVFDRFELCAHIEMVVFLATIGSIPAMVRNLVPGTCARGGWVTVFLFPGVFLYDSNLNVGADHIAALWAIPIMLSLLRLWSGWSIREGVLFSVFVSAAALTKYSAVNIIVPPVVALVIRAFASPQAAGHRSGDRARWIAPDDSALAKKLALVRRSDLPHSQRAPSRAPLEFRSAYAIPPVQQLVGWDRIGLLVVARRSHCGADILVPSQ
jgi:hypothetical protein